MWKTRTAVLSVAVLALLFTLSPPLLAGGDQGNGTPRTQLVERAQPKNVSKTQQGESIGRNRITTKPQSPSRSESSSFAPRGTPGAYIGDAFQFSTLELPTTSGSRIPTAMSFGSTFHAGYGSPIGAFRHADSSMECVPR